MFKKKCPSCARKAGKDFGYCPYCGASFRVIQENENFGMLGREDSTEHIREELKLPFGMNKIVNSLVKQLEKQMNDMNGEMQSGMPRGFKIRIASGQPQMRQIMKTGPRFQRNDSCKLEVPKVSEEESKKRASLPKVEVESKIKRLADRILYEIEAPGVRTKNDIVLTKLASGLEIKAYSDKKCYVKFIPLTVEVIEYYVREEKVFVELKI